ncbi:molybdopterin-synthase adenylyltransferase MoeB [Gynuella sunshinyii]|uniref:Molybdopterin-synthase adenylyltransferase n=1 Tax=Gynuella sunshinyii YC6258 TaxID=1445510 RepID=A0A0C5VHL1_9GAMM|nr:molybdopterin-synthase adenylyltransferase MoeB [Gynuella sunshinyii]AJQ92823.1 dinucleotide-utilizing enzyme involved in molybdopterin and thiamine biosynthesis family 2 [Gynuella sunshinyii YC6258]
MFTAQELSRYSRHLTLSEFGLEGQRRLKNARVLLVGAGGLGSPAGLYLAAAGVGIIGIVDADVVEDSNLQRQVLFTTADIGQSKANQAAVHLQQLNPHITVHSHHIALNRHNAMTLIADYDLVVDGSDNFPTRYLVNDACVLLDKPYVYGSIYQFEGQASVFHHADGPCYRCLFPEPPAPGQVPSCAEAGVLGVLPAMIATIQTTEAIKLITGIGQTLSGRLLQYHALDMRFDELTLSRDPQCPICGDQPVITELIDYEAFCGMQPAVSLITATELKTQLKNNPDIQLIDVREPYEREICQINNSRSIPLATLIHHHNELVGDRMIVCICKSGGRSATATRQLQAAGCSQVYSLEGGILAWIDQIDPCLTRY